MKRRGAGRASAPTWQEGWLAEAERLASTNHEPRSDGVAVDLVVVHSISLPPGEFGSDAIERLFTNRLDWDAHPYFASIRGLRVSAHFLIRRDGHLLQFVSCRERAWHAGVSSWQGRGDCNDYSVGIELEGLEGGVFEAIQYERLGGLLRRLAEAYPIDAIVGHEHVAPGRKHDPGDGFDWRRLRASIAGLPVRLATSD